MSEQNKSYMAAVSEKRLGRVWDQPGSTFELHNILQPGSMLGSDAFEEVYLRTASGNIYFLDSEGNFYNKNATVQVRTWQGSRLDPEQFTTRKIKVGESFRYGSPGNTDEVKEIVAVNGKHYDPGYLKELTEGATNPIRTDFMEVRKQLKVR